MWKILSCPTTDVMLNEITQTKKERHYMILLLCETFKKVKYTEAEWKGGYHLWKWRQREVLAKEYSTAVTEDEDVSSSHVQRTIMNNTGLNTGNL